MIGRHHGGAPMRVATHHTAEELERLAARQSNPRAWRRFRGLILALRGELAERIAAALGCTARAVQKWVARYSAGGAAALADRPGRGLIRNQNSSGAL